MEQQKALRECEAAVSAGLAAYRSGQQLTVAGFPVLLMPFHKLAAVLERWQLEPEALAVAVKILSSGSLSRLLQLQAHAAEHALAAGFPELVAEPLVRPAAGSAAAAGNAPRPTGARQQQQRRPQQPQQPQQKPKEDYFDRMDRRGAVDLQVYGAATRILSMCLAFPGDSNGGTPVGLPRAAAAVVEQTAAALLRMHVLHWPGTLAARAVETLAAFQAAAPPLPLPAVAEVAAGGTAAAGSSSTSSGGDGRCGDLPLPSSAVAAAHAEAVVRSHVNHAVLVSCGLVSAFSVMATEQFCRQHLDRSINSSSSRSSSSSGSSSSNGRQQQLQQAGPSGPLLAALVAEIGSSCFLEQAARLALQEAACMGRRRLRQPAVMAHVEGHMRTCYVYRADDAGVLQPSDLCINLVSQLCRLANDMCFKRRMCITSKHCGLTPGAIRELGGDGSSSGGGSSRSGGSNGGSSSGGSSGGATRGGRGGAGAAGSGASASAAAAQTEPPLVAPWGACMHTLVLAEAVAGLAVAGFGGGVRGTWGLPPELVAGLPVLGLDSRGRAVDLGPLLQQQQLSGGVGSSGSSSAALPAASPAAAVASAAATACSGAAGASRQGPPGTAVHVLGLHAMPFRALCTAVEEQLLISELPGVGAAAAAAAAAAASQEALARGVFSGSGGSNSSSGRGRAGSSNSGARGGNSSGSTGQRQACAADGPLPWRLPLGRRALAVLCLRITDLAAAGHGQAYAAASAAGAAGGPASAAGGPASAASAAYASGASGSSSGSSNSGSSSSGSSNSGSSSSGSSSSGSSSTGALQIRIRPHQIWLLGTQAIADARRLLLLSPGIDGRHRTASAASAAPASATTGSASNATAAGTRTGRSAATATPAGPQQQQQQQRAAVAAAAPGGYPLLPAAWWQSLAALLHVPVPLHPAYMAEDANASWQYNEDGTVRSSFRVSPAAAESEGGLLVPQPYERLAEALRLQGMPGILLPLQPPPSLAVALQAGLVPAFEAALRRAPDARMAARLAAALLQPDWLAAHEGADDGLGWSWPQLQQLLAFAPPPAAAALVASLGKRLQLALDQAEAAVAPAAAGGGGGGSSAGRVVLTTPALMLARQLAAALPLMALVDLDAVGADGVGCFCTDSTDLAARALRAMSGSASSRMSRRGGSGSSGGGGEASPAAVTARRLQWARVRLLLSHTLHRWLPALSRFARRLPGAELRRLVQCRLQEVDTSPAGCFDVMVACACVSKLLVWIQPPLLALAAAEHEVAVNWDREATLRNIARGGMPRLQAERAGCSSRLASWRHFLIHEVDVVGVLGAAIQVVLQLMPRPTLQFAMAAATGRPEPGMSGAMIILPMLLPALRTACNAAPDVLAEPLLHAAQQAPAAASGSPWSKVALQELFAMSTSQVRVTQDHEVIQGMRQVEDDVPQAVEGLREFAREHGAQAARAHFGGGPSARHACIASEGALGLAYFTPVSRLEVRQGAVAAAGMTNESGVFGLGPMRAGGAAAAASAVPADPPTPLRCCANPRCTNLAAAVGADSDAQLPLLNCGGCRGAAAYCGRGCQAAHWRAGHKEACAALHGEWR